MEVTSPKVRESISYDNGMRLVLGPVTYGASKVRLMRRQLSVGWCEQSVSKLGNTTGEPWPSTDTVRFILVCRM